MKSADGDAPGRAKPEIVLRQPKPGDLGWIIQRHAQIYLDEYGWGENFESVCADIVADFARKHDPAYERCWIAEMNGQNAGSVFLVKEADGVARLRLLLVDPAARGTYLFRPLLVPGTVLLWPLILKRWRALERSKE